MHGARAPMNICRGTLKSLGCLFSYHWLAKIRNCENCSARRHSHESHLAAPIFRVIEEVDNLFAGIFRKIAFAEACVEYIVPIGKHLQANVVLCQIVPALMLVQTLRSVIEDTQAIGHLRSRCANTDVEAELAQPICDKVFNQQHPLPRFENPFYLFGATVALGLLTDIDHRLLDEMRDKRGIRDTRGLSSRNYIDVGQANGRFY